MEVVTTESIKIPNSVIISGPLNSDVEKEVIIFLKTHGAINRLFHIDDNNSPFHEHLICEFSSGASMESLKPFGPKELESLTMEDVTCQIKALADVYTPTASRTATSSYLEGLKDIAKLSGKSFEELLREELATLASAAPQPPGTETQVQMQSVRDPTPAPGQRSSGHQLDSIDPSGAPTAMLPPMSPPIPVQNLTKDDRSPATPRPETKTLPHLTVSDLNPPDLQRVVVEHIVRTQEAVSHAPSRLRAFSGRSPRPANEVDYDTWRTNVESIMNDPAISDLHRTRRILDSLLPPATEITKHLGSQAPPTTCLELLDSAYGTVEDGDELFAKFMATFQNSGEKPSSYLQRLQIALSAAVKRGGVNSTDVDRHLLRQFCRGCWEDMLLADLQLEQRKSNPPSFAELLLLLRTEEDRQAAKVTRMKQHLGPTKQPPKQRVVSHLQSACVYTDCSETEELKKQVCELQAQLANMKTKKGKKAKSAETKVAKVRTETTKAKSQQPTNGQRPNKPRPWYCFRCGEDGHIATTCEDEPNPSLVADKKKKLRERQKQWEAQTASTDEGQLND